MTNEMIREVSRKISNYIYQDNLTATMELMELFDRISYKELKTADDYIQWYDDFFYTYTSWKWLVKSEEDINGLTEKELKEQMNKTIWKLPCGWFVQYV